MIQLGRSRPHRRALFNVPSSVANRLMGVQAVFEKKRFSCLWDCLITRKGSRFIINEVNKLDRFRPLRCDIT